MKKKKAMLNQKSKETSRSAVSVVRSCVFSNLFASMLWLVLLLLFSALLSKSENPGKFISPIGFGCSAVSAFACGLFAGKMSKNPGILCGLICGGVFVIIMFVLSFAFADSTGNIVYSTALLVCVLACSVIGAKLGSKPKSRTKRVSRR